MAGVLGAVAARHSQWVDMQVAEEVGKLYQEVGFVVTLWLLDESVVAGMTSVAADKKQGLENVCFR